MVKEDDLTLGEGHSVQHTDHVPQKCTLETYMILLTNVTEIHLILKLLSHCLLEILRSYSYAK